MTTSLRADYAARMDRVARCIERRLAEGAVPTVDELADAAALSRFHFHRLFRLLTGETVMETVTRLRIAMATDAVVNAGSSITEAAQRAGYASSQSLARAAKRETGMSMSELALGGGKSGAIGAHEFPLRLEFLALDPIKVGSAIATGPYERLNLAYRGLAGALMAGVPAPQILGVYGVPIDDPREVAPEDHRFQCCIAVDPESSVSGVDSATLAGGNYARQRVEATYDALPALLDRVYLQLLEDGLTMRDAPAFYHYLDQPGAEDGADVVHVTDIYLPVVAPPA
jgi:AraC family transcriptional regulator